ncbi:MAG: hypothetical protein K6G85_03085 [Eubacterium sp.]|nr:hypothetical protein [Eubacterium sp.]
MTKAMKKVLSVVLSIAMIATSITVYNTTVKAAETFGNVEGVAETDGTITVNIGSKPDGWTMIEAYILEGAQDANATVTDNDAAVNGDANWNWNVAGRVYGGVNGNQADKIAKNAAGTALKGNTLYTVILIAYTGENLGDSTTEIDRVAVQVTTAEKEEIVEVEDAKETVNQAVQTVPADDSADWVRINGTSTDGSIGWVYPNVNGNAGLWGFYDTASQGANWNGVGNTVIYNKPVFAFVKQHGDSVTIGENNGTATKYTNPKNVANQLVWVGGGDCVYINQSLLTAPAGQTKIYSVTLGTGDSFLIKIQGPTDPEEETAPDQTLTGFDWVQFPGGIGEANSIYDQDGNDVFISNNAVDGDNAFFKKTDIYGLYTDATNVPYIPGTNTVTGATLSFATTRTENIGAMQSVWVDGTRYANKSADVFMDGDQIHISQNLIALPANQDEKVFYITIRGTVDDTFAIKVAKRATHTVSIDGTVVDTVTEGDTYTLPTTAQYGYFVGDDLYKAGAQVVVNDDIEFTSLTSVSVTMAEGAVVKNAAPAGIAFQATVTVNENEEAVDAAFLSTGMLITANDLFVEKGGSELALDSDYTFKNVENTGWFAGNTGTYRAGISGVTSENYIRKFIARGYAKLTYTDGTDTVVYSGMSPVRSIQQVAQAAINAGYGNDFLEESAGAK